MLPASWRRSVPDSIRHHPLLRGAALAAGLIPPRTMHSAAEAAELARLADGARCIVELGVYEGSSAIVLCAALPPDAELHLVDPYPDESGWALPNGWRGVAVASRRTVGRHARRGGPRVQWHIARSQDVGRSWTGPAPDAVFIDGDHSPAGCRADWDAWHRHVRIGGAVAFHDARLGAAGGTGSPGPTQVVDDLFRTAGPPAGWTLEHEVDSLVVARRSVD